jgi:outer membrane protein
VDLLNAQTALELARAEDVRARTDFLVGIAQLARATGRLELPTEGTKGP